MGENSCIYCVIGTVLVIVVLLIVIILPLSFVTLEYNEVNCFPYSLFIKLYRMNYQNKSRTDNFINKPTKINLHEIRNQEWRG